MELTRTPPGPADRERLAEPSKEALEALNTDPQLQTEPAVLHNGAWLFTHRSVQRMLTRARAEGIASARPDRLDALFAKLPPEPSVVDTTRRLLQGGVAAPREIEAALIDWQRRGLLNVIKALLEIAENGMPFQAPPEGKL